VKIGVCVPGPGSISPARFEKRRAGRGVMEPGPTTTSRNKHFMSASDQTTGTASSGWLANQPYVLLCITALCWAGNAIVGRLAAGHIPPVMLSFLRWSAAFLIILPFAWKHLKRDWSAIRGQLGVMILLSVTGISAFNTMQYWALEHTQALNTLLLQSAGPLFVAVWSLILLGYRLTPAQAGGIVLSLAGVLVILLHGDFTTLANIEFNRGDIVFIAALAIFGIYSVMSLKRPQIHGLSFGAFTFGCGAACLIPLLIWEMVSRPLMQLDAANLLTLFYVAVFPSTLAFLCFNRGVQLIGANRAAPFFHLVPVFGAVMAMVFLGERPQLFHIIGFALVLSGVFIASRNPAKSGRSHRGRD
jgi:drug/metabolite transporter (DMT)-like permease